MGSRTQILALFLAVTCQAHPQPAAAEGFLHT